MWRLYMGSAMIACIFAIMVAPKAQAICRTEASAYMAYDTSPQSEDGPYDPCDSYAKWSVKFYRTDKSTDYTILQWTITAQNGSLIDHHEFDSRNYNSPYTWYNPQGTDYVGPSTWHKLTLKKATGPGGHFESISLDIDYVASDPTLPPR
jgi:hypothetical protein